LATLLATLKLVVDPHALATTSKVATLSKVAIVTTPFGHLAGSPALRLHLPDAGARGSEHGE
jgi:hypothetical protein